MPAKVANETKSIRDSVISIYPTKVSIIYSPLLTCFEQLAVGWLGGWGAEAFGVLSLLAHWHFTTDVLISLYFIFPTQYANNIQPAIVLSQTVLSQSVTKHYCSGGV